MGRGHGHMTPFSRVFFFEWAKPDTSNIIHILSESFVWKFNCKKYTENIMKKKQIEMYKPTLYTRVNGDL